MKLFLGILCFCGISLESKSYNKKVTLENYHNISESSVNTNQQVEVPFGEDFDYYDIDDDENLLHRNYIHIRVISSRDGVLIKVDEKEVINFYSKNNSKIENYLNTTDGLHCVVISPRSGKVLTNKIFTTELWGESIGIFPLFSTFNQDEIFILAVKYDAGLNLGKSARGLFKSMGTIIAHLIDYRTYFVWVLTKSGKIFLESASDELVMYTGDVYTSPMKSEVLIPKSTFFSCWDRIIKESTLPISEIRRAEFCNKYGGYGILCNCNSPMDIKFPEKELLGNVIRDEPVLIIGKNRPLALYRCIFTLLTQPGGKKANIIVAIDGHNKEIEDMLLMLEIRFVNNDLSMTEDLGGRISLHYKFSMTKTFQHFPKSKYILVLEEDVFVSPDFLSFFNQTAKLLASDPSLYCVSAWNDLSAMHTGGNPRRVMRTETQPAYGWMVTRNFFEEINLFWFGTKDYDWDIWFRGPWVRADRECIIPEISRSFHMATSGAHIKGQMTMAHFMGHLSTAKENIILEGLDRLTEAAHEEDLYSLFESDQIVYVNTTLHPCHSNYIVRNYTEKSLLIFFHMESDQDNLAWSKITSCLGLLNLDTRNHHRGLFRFYFYNTKVYAIGYPFSDYSYFKPQWLHPVSKYRTEWDQKYLNLFALRNRKRFRVPSYEQYLNHPLILDNPRSKPHFLIVY